MINNDNILAIIPARGGSKRLPGKNIKLLAGKPMIAYAIEAAKKSGYIDRLIVSTDDKKIADVAEKFGALVPFIRPPELASDEAKSIDVIKHAISFMEHAENFFPAIIVLIQPTSPLVLASDIDGVIRNLVDSKKNSCATVVKATQRPEWMYQLRAEGPVPYTAQHNTDSPGQSLQELYSLNGAAYALRRDTAIKDGLIIDSKSFSAVVMPRERSVDIDEQYDFEFAQLLLQSHEYQK
ncbi:MAG: acylneuraminate cytidylyltransferase family protein [Patescibacteria group bacterium]|jgi:CMP-N,N'-diacetyllegionaminic acid synthase